MTSYAEYLCDELRIENERLRAERDALLAALKATLPYLPENIPGHEYIKPKILAAIREAG